MAQLCVYEHFAISPALDVHRPSPPLEKRARTHSRSPQVQRRNLTALDGWIAARTELISSVRHLRRFLGLVRFCVLSGGPILAAIYDQSEEEDEEQHRLEILIMRQTRPITANATPGEWKTRTMSRASPSLVSIGVHSPPCCVCVVPCRVGTKRGGLKSAPGEEENFSI